MAGLVAAVNGGDELDILKTTRILVASQLESCESGRDIASLSKQMQELTAKISQLEKAQKKRKKATPLEMARKAVNG